MRKGAIDNKEHRKQDDESITELFKTLLASAQHQNQTGDSVVEQSSHQARLQYRQEKEVDD